jgi:predicted ABC-type sugar transport system permease subunit
MTERWPNLRSSRLAARGWDWRSYVIYIGFAVILVFFSVTLGGRGFLQPTNLINIINQTATISVMAVGMTLVIAAAETCPLVRSPASPRWSPLWRSRTGVWFPASRPAS